MDIDNLLILSEDRKTVYGVKDRTVVLVTIHLSVTRIGEEAFDGCTSLESIDIPNRVSCIGEGAFRGCTSLVSIDI